MIDPSPSPSPLSQFLAELKHRRVVRVALVYLVVGWAVIEGAATLTELLDLPGWAGRVALTLVLLGFPVALVLAWAFDLTPEGVKRTSSQDPPTAASSAPGLRRGAWLVLALLVTGLVGWLTTQWVGTAGSPEADSIDPDVVAVLPFRVAGADPSLAFLREGMLDLLATKLTGEAGPRAVDPRTLMSAWRRARPAQGGDLEPAAARRLARELAAGRAVMGEVVGTPESVVLTASVLSSTAQEGSETVTVRGPVDSLPDLVDRLTAGLLSVGAGERSHRVGHLTSTSLPALRAYLEGRAANRRGDYDDGRRHFEAALERDSTFALAALGLFTSAAWLGGMQETVDRALGLAWSARERLSPRDRAVLNARVGPRYPLGFSAAEQLAGWERALELADDRAEVWEGYGDLYFHYGRVLGIPDAQMRSDEALGRAVALDSGLVGSLMHLVQSAAQRGDTAATRRLANVYLARDSASAGATFVRWRAAHALGDSAMLASLRLDSLSLNVLFWIAITGQEEGFAAHEAERAARTHYRQAHTPAERRRSARALYHTLLNRGRPAEALSISREMEAFWPDPDDLLVNRVLAGLYSDGDPDAAAAAAAELAAARDDRSDEPRPGSGRAEQLGPDCALEQWRLWRGEFDTVDRTLDRLHAARVNGQPLPAALTCAALLEALRAVVENGADAAARVGRLDSILRGWPPSFHDTHYGMVALARLHESLGQPGDALTAARRRAHWSPWAVVGLAPLVREEARLAAATGDTTGAIRAYSHYLALRDDPEPTLRADAERARAELARLTHEGTAAN